MRRTRSRRISCFGGALGRRAHPEPDRHLALPEAKGDFAVGRALYAPGHVSVGEALAIDVSINVRLRRSCRRSQCCLRPITGCKIQLQRVLVIRHDR